jgi:ferredoxin-NADP reductase
MATPGGNNGTQMTDVISAPHAKWQKSSIIAVLDRTPDIKSFFLQLSAPFSHQAGQHVDVRLTAPDGYIAMRSYSIASAPSETGILELAIERLPDGEVSPFFHDVAELGDEIELRGPLGGHFIWPGDASSPVLLIGAGSGVAPLAAMVRQRRASGQSVPTVLLMSARTIRDTLFLDELLAAEESQSGFSFRLALTREAATRSGDFCRRIDAAMVADVAGRMPSPPGHVFICGSNAFVNIAVDGVLAAGLPTASIKTERYGA